MFSDSNSNIVNKQFPNVYLELLGGNLEDQFLKEYQELAGTLNIEDQVRFLGSQAKQQVLETRECVRQP